MIRVVMGEESELPWDEIDRRLRLLNPEKRERIASHLKRILEAEEIAEHLISLPSFRVAATHRS